MSGFTRAGFILFAGLLALTACGPSDEQNASDEVVDAGTDAPDTVGVSDEEAAALDDNSGFAPAENPDDATAEGLHEVEDPGEDLYRRGHYREALEYWEVAAEEGDAYAAYRLGVEYIDANVVERDINYSVRYMQLATELGSPAGMFELGGFYEAGIGVEPDIDRAAELYLQSALRGFPPAQHNIATMFEDGVGVRQDLVRAYMFYDLAISQGFRVNFEQYNPNEGVIYVDPRVRLEEMMTAEELAIAHEEIEAFVPLGE